MQAEYQFPQPDPFLPARVPADSAHDAHRDREDAEEAEHPLAQLGGGRGEAVDLGHMVGRQEIPQAVEKVDQGGEGEEDPDIHGGSRGWGLPPRQARGIAFGINRQVASSARGNRRGAVQARLKYLKPDPLSGPPLARAYQGFPICPQGEKLILFRCLPWDASRAVYLSIRHGATCHDVININIHRIWHYCIHIS